MDAATHQVVVVFPSELCNKAADMSFHCFVAASHNKCNKGFRGRRYVVSHVTRKLARELGETSAYIEGPGR